MEFKRFEPFFIRLDHVDSTNNYAANLLKTTKVVNGTAILTKRQDKGRGQGNTIWQSEFGKNLILSVIIHPNLSTSQAFYLNVATSLAVRKTLDDLGLKAEIKWPNDVLVNDKKIAGILIENQLRSHTIHTSILGIGLNVNQSEFDPELKATSVFIERSVKPEIEAVFTQLYQYLDFYIDLLMQSNFALLKKLYMASLYRLDKASNYQDKQGFFRGTIKGLDEVGRLVIQKEDGSSAVYDLKEVTYLSE